MKSVKLKEIIAGIALTAALLAPYNSAQSIVTSPLQQTSSLESIVKNDKNIDNFPDADYKIQNKQYSTESSYKKQSREYLKQLIESKEDMSNRVPLKWLNILPETMMGGVLGFTYIGDPSMGRRADLTGSTARMVDIHESIHTTDEYETKRITDWILEKPNRKYIK